MCVCVCTRAHAFMATVGMCSPVIYMCVCVCMYVCVCFRRSVRARSLTHTTCSCQMSHERKIEVCVCLRARSFPMTRHHTHTDPFFIPPPHQTHTHSPPSPSTHPYSSLLSVVGVYKKECLTGWCNLSRLRSQRINICESSDTRCVCKTCMAVCVCV
jgi:hypothetical protein